MPGTADMTVLDAREGFRRWAAVYDEVPNPLLSLESRLAAPLLPSLRGKTVLDLGCGTGRRLPLLCAREARRVIALDASQEMLVRAAARASHSARLLRASCDLLPLAGACCDVALCSFTLAYLPDLDRFLEELRRVMAPGSYVLISDVHPDTARRGWRRSFRAAGEEIEIANFVRPLRAIRHALAAAGFTNVNLLEAAFGDPEREMFARAGKAGAFDEAASAPAIYIAQCSTPFRQRATVRSLDCASTFSGARVATSATAAARSELVVSGASLTIVNRPRTGALDLSGYLLLPGLINSHDHLEFSLFPRLGRRVYGNSQEWANDIHRPGDSPVRENRAVPRPVRYWWGALKNLYAGVTTVAHHNPWEEMFSKLPIHVASHYGWAHSLALDGNVRAAFRSTPPAAPFIIHLAEGTGVECENEIFELDRIGCLAPNTVIVHGTALTAAGRALIAERGAALVWCPSSNLSTLGATLSPQELRECGRAALGTDSAISNPGDLLDEIRLARALGAPAEWLYELVTQSAADVLRLTGGEGVLADGHAADFIALADDGSTPAAALCKASMQDVHLVVVSGRVQMFSPELERRLAMCAPDFEQVTIDGTSRFVRAPIGDMLREARAHLGAEVRLAGKVVTQ